MKKDIYLIISTIDKMLNSYNHSIKKSVLLGILLVSTFLVYKSEYLLFDVLEKVDDASNHKLKLIGFRNKFLHGVNAINPFIGRDSLDSLDSLDVINISINNSSLSKLKKSYNLILDDMKQTGIQYLYSDINPYIKCDILYKGQKYDAKMRFHGTASGHIIHDKKSYAIKLNKSKLLNNVRRFSLVIPEKQTPVAFEFEYNLINWFTGFKVEAKLIRVKINGVDGGIYSFEEKASKELLEKNNLSGVDIVKSKNEFPYNSLPFEIPFYDVKKNSKKILNQYLQWSKVYNSESFDEIKHLLDLDKFAKNDALRALLSDLHGYTMTNQKLLYNTSTGRFFPLHRYESRIKPLVLDDLSPRKSFDKALTGVNSGNANMNPLLEKLIQNDLYRIERNKYLFELLNNKKLILEMYDKVYSKNIPIIYADNTNQAPSQQFVSIANKKRKLLVFNFNIIEKYLNYSRVYTVLTEVNKNKYLLTITPDSNSPIIINKLDLKLDFKKKFYIKDIQSNKTIVINTQIDLDNFFKDKLFLSGLDKHLNFKKNIYQYEIFSDYNLKIDKYKISFKNYFTNNIVEKRNTYQLLVEKSLNYYDNYTKNNNIKDFLKKSELPFIIKEKNLILNNKTYIINNNLVLPRGYNLIIRSGTKIKIAPGKSILVYGGIKVEGTKKNSVIVENLEKNKPFGVFGAIGDNQTTQIDINYLNISGGKDTIINGAYLSGALSLYSHKKVKIKNSYIHHNSADDGLNIKSAKVEIKNNIFNANLADQVDLDFCEGIVENNKFIESSLLKDYNNVKIPKDDNGDGLDFSGSKIIVKNNYYDGFLDKGISVGENTKALIENNIFKNNRSAITVKDQSDVYISSNKYIDNEINLEMYQKKQIFNYPSIYNINEKHPIDKIKKAKKAYYYKQDSLVNLEDLNISTVFGNLKKKNWVEYE